MSEIMNKEDKNTKSSTLKMEDTQVNADLELQSFDLKSQEKSNFLTVPPNPYFNRHFGNNLVCWFRRNEPILTLGPHCIIFILINILKNF